MFCLCRKCECQSVIRSVYRDLTVRRIRHADALSAVLKIFQMYHPDIMDNRARIIIYDWLKA